MFQFTQNELDKIVNISQSCDMHEMVEQAPKETLIKWIHGIKALNERGNGRKAKALYNYLMDYMMDEYDISVDEIIYA